MRKTKKLQKTTESARNCSFLSPNVRNPAESSGNPSTARRSKNQAGTQQLYLETRLYPGLTLEIRTSKETLWDQLTWLENGPNLKMYSLLKMGIFQLAMLVYCTVAQKICVFQELFLLHKIEGEILKRSEFLKFTLERIQTANRCRMPSCYLFYSMGFSMSITSQVRILEHLLPRALSLLHQDLDGQRHAGHAIS